MSRNSTKISVVIPAYNVEKQLGEQLEALLSNSDIIQEIIVADNRSRDRTPLIAKEFSVQNSKVKYLDASDRQGVSFARNRGIEATHNEFVLLCDADDIVLPGWADALAEALDTADCAGTGYTVFPYDETQAKYREGETILDQPSVFGHKFYCLGGSMGLRKTAWMNLGGFDESYRGGHEEVDLCLRFEQGGYRQAWVPRPLMKYRQRQSKKGLARQSRSYGRTWIQLVNNFSPEFDESLPSLKLMVRKVLLDIPPYLLKKDKSWEEIRGFWWNIGRLEGIFRYNTLKKMPERQLADFA